MSWWGQEHQALPQGAGAKILASSRSVPPTAAPHFESPAPRGQKREYRERQTHPGPPARFPEEGREALRVLARARGVGRRGDPGLGDAPDRPARRWRRCRPCTAPSCASRRSWGWPSSPSSPWCARSTWRHGDRTGLGGHDVELAATAAAEGRRGAGEEHACSGHAHVRVAEASGDPPERYIFELRGARARPRGGRRRAAARRRAPRRGVPRGRLPPTAALLPDGDARLPPERRPAEDLRRGPLERRPVARGTGVPDRGDDLLPVVQREEPAERARGRVDRGARVSELPLFRGDLSGGAAF